MNVKKQVLLDAAQTAQDTYKAKRERYDQAAAEYRKRVDLKSATDAMERQKLLRDALSAAIKAKKPLTVAELERDASKYTNDRNWGYLKYVGSETIKDIPRRFVLDGVTYEPPAAIPQADLQGLIAVLEAVEEDVISDGQLQRFGFKNMAWVLRAAVANGGEVK